MMKRDWPTLFSDGDLGATLRAQQAKIADLVRQLGDDAFDTKSDDFLAASVSGHLAVDPLRLDLDDVEMETSETQIDVSHDPHRVFTRPGPHYVPGLEVTFFVPFSGDPTLWKLRPNRYTTVIPRAVVGEGELRFPYDSADRNLKKVKAQFDEDVAEIQRWMEWVNAQVDEYNASLNRSVLREVQKRRSELEKTKSQVEDLGIPIRDRSKKPAMPGNRPEPKKPEARREAREQASRDYDVALSFAGEQRDYVEAVAKELENLEVTVFYDDFEKVELWGADLAEHFHEVYSKRSHFVVLFASKEYAKKAWPAHERRSALSRQFRGEKGRVLPVRFDSSEIPGLPDTTGYLDARTLAPQQLAELIRQKLDRRD